MYIDNGRNISTISNLQLAEEYLQQIHQTLESLHHLTSIWPIVSGTHSPPQNYHPVIKIRNQREVGNKVLVDKTSTVYMGEMQGIQDSLTHSISQEETTSIRVFTDNRAALKALENPNKCSAPQIMQGTVLRLDILKTQGKLVSFHWIPSHKDIKGNEEADIAAKEATGWRKAKRKNGKCKE